MSGSQRQLLELLDQSGGRLHALLLKLTLREDVAEELMQDLFIKLSQANPRDQIQNLYAYAHRSATNLAFDWRRKQRRAPLRLDDAYDPPAKHDSALGKLIRSEEVEEVFGALDKLNGAYRQAFVMRYIQQDSYEEIAEHLGKTAHQARGLCSRAMSCIRDTLGRNHRPADGKGVDRVEN